MKRTEMLFATIILTAFFLRPLHASADCIVIEDFSSSAVNNEPIGWKLRQSKGRDIYLIQSENGMKYLKAKAENKGIEIDKKISWDLNKYPILKWKWKPSVFPSGSNESDGDKNDSVLGLYVGFKNSSACIKYIWSERLKVGTRINTGFLGKTKMLVVNSGKKITGDWVEVKVNLANDFKNIIGSNKFENPNGIALLTDSDATKSYAEGNYSSIYACTQ